LFFISFSYETNSSFLLVVTKFMIMYNIKLAGQTIC